MVRFNVRIFKPRIGDDESQHFTTSTTPLIYNDIWKPHQRVRELLIVEMAISPLIYCAHAISIKLSKVNSLPGNS